jgi:hypothetical protein
MRRIDASKALTLSGSIMISSSAGVMSSTRECARPRRVVGWRHISWRRVVPFACHYRLKRAKRSGTDGTCGWDGLRYRWDEIERTKLVEFTLPSGVCEFDPRHPLRKCPGQMAVWADRAITGEWSCPVRATTAAVRPSMSIRVGPTVRGRRRCPRDHARPEMSTKRLDYLGPSSRRSPDDITRGCGKGGGRTHLQVRAERG